MEFAKKYNDVRSKVARGDMPRFPSISVPNMMEATWSKEALTYAEDIVNQLCSKGNYSTGNGSYHILVAEVPSTQPGIFDSLADAFYGTPENYNNVTLQQLAHLEITEIGCSLTMCRNMSYAVCAHGKVTKCSGNCTIFEKGAETCSKCPTGSKCTLDGLCSMREDAITSISRIPFQYQSSFIRYLTIARTRIAIGFQKFKFNEKGEEEPTKLPSAAKMMEVKWSDTAASIAETAMADYCKNGTSTLKNGKYHLLVAEKYKAKYYDVYDPEMLTSVFFDMSETAFPLYLTPEFVNSGNYSDFFSWKRAEIMTARDEITEIGCSMAYCRAYSVNICAFGEITCSSNCSVYETGTTCSKCPTGSKCSFDNICSFRSEASTNFTKISKENQKKIVDKINESRSIISIGEHEISTNLDGQMKQGKFPSATNMMVMEWNDSSVLLAESKLRDWCKYGQQWSYDLQNRYLAWSTPVALDYSSRNNTAWDIPVDKYFTPSFREWSLFMTAEQHRTVKMIDIFRSDRRDILLSWASISYIGCAMEYCRGEIVLMCLMGEFSECSNGCSVYKNGTACSQCSDNTTCADGLCRKLSHTVEDEEKQVVEQSHKGSDMIIIKLELLLVLILGVCLFL